MLESISSIKDFRSFRVLATLAVALLAACLLAFAAFSPAASANHSWGNYHWGRTANPFTVKLGDNLSSTWKPYLQTVADAGYPDNPNTVNDWHDSTVLDDPIVQGQASTKRCSPTSGRVEVCNATYGNNGWLGVASIWLNGSHIVQGTVKLNDTYFNKAPYNTPPWRNLVMCQEVGHTFGLDHQDENFDNLNLGTCMDYTRDPDGDPNASPSNPDNEYPNQHDYDQLNSIYTHLDSSNTVRASTASNLPAEMNRIDTGDPGQRGRLVRASHDGRLRLYERDFGQGKKVLTWVIRANSSRA